MKIYIYDWAGQARKRLEALGITPDQYLEDKTEEDLWKLARQILFDGKLEIMIRDMDPLKPHSEMQIAVDVLGGRFRTR